MTINESRTNISLEAALRLMSPLVKMLLQDGVTYPRFANALKTVFLEAAQSVLDSQNNQETSAVRVNDSSISTLSGVHRKDVREWRQAGKTLIPAKPFGVAMEVYTRWASDKCFLDSKGEPRRLERTGAGSFDELVASISTDVHPRAVLDELLRLGVVNIDDEAEEKAPTRLRLCAGAFIPKEGYAEMMQLFADNVGDHIATAARNVRGNEAPLLEQSIFADGLNPQSAAALSELSRKLWTDVFQHVVREATQLSEQDKGMDDAKERVRLGMYFYREQEK
jgi:hypothetical protein